MISEETAFLREVGADLVVVDIALMACTAARRAGLRCVVSARLAFSKVAFHLHEVVGEALVVRAQRDDLFALRCLLLFGDFHTKVRHRRLFIVEVCIPSSWGLGFLLVQETYQTLAPCIL